jgi:hypothetical protein
MMSMPRRSVVSQGRPREYYAGKGGWTQEAIRRGFNLWPAVELFAPDGTRQEGFNLLSRSVVQKELKFITSGSVTYGFFGTPCTTMSALFQQCGPGTRTKVRPEGTGIDTREIEGNIHAMVTMLLSFAIWLVGGEFMIENPARSWLFHLPITVMVADFLQARTSWKIFTLHQCRYGLHPPDDPNKRYAKKTCIACSKQCYLLSKTCSNGETCGCLHIPIQGSVNINGVSILRSRQAGAYPPALCAAMVTDLLGPR